MSKQQNNDAKKRLKLTPPEVLAMTSPPIVTMAQYGGIVCPFCSNGTGEDGTGIEPNLTDEGFRYYCHRCGNADSGGKSFDNIDIASKALNIPIQGKENKSNFIPLIKKALELVDAIGEDAQVNYAIARKNYVVKKNEEEPTDYLPFLKQSHAKLKGFVNECGGTWRGLTYDTLQRFFCGIYEYYSEDNHDLWFKRVVIPSSRYHFLARLHSYADGWSESIKKGFEKYAKIHRGSKSVFGMLKEVIARRKSYWNDDFTTHSGADWNNPIFLVEGEIDAMSGYQMTHCDFFALSGCHITQSMKEEFMIGVDLPPSVFIVILDNDEAGKKNTQKVVDILKDLGHLVFQFTLEMAVKKSDGIFCKDLNDTLIYDPEKIQDILFGLYEQCKARAIDYDGEKRKWTVQDNADYTSIHYTPPNSADEVYSFGAANLEELDKNIQIAQGIVNAVAANDSVQSATQDVIQPPATNPISRWTQEANKTCPINLLPPNGFEVTDKAVLRNGVAITNMPILPTRKFVDADSKQTSTELVYYNVYFKQWYYFTVPDKTINDKKCISNLTDYGVSIVQGKHTHEYLAEFFTQIVYIHENVENIPCCMSHTIPGWLDNECTKFLYPHRDIDNHTLKNDNNFYDGKFTQNGDETAWCDKICELFSDIGDSPIFRVLLGASLMAPLLKPLKVRNSQYCVWGTTGAGKSAAAKAAMSVWGDPEKHKQTFNNTSNYTSDSPAYHNDLPTWTDEFQSARKDIREDIPRIIYSFAEGTTRGRLSIGGNAKKSFKFRGVRIMTAEQPVVTSNVDAGAFNRLLTLHSSRVFASAVDLSDIHSFFDFNYGFLGPKWIDFISIPANLEEIRKKYLENRINFREKAKEGRWCDTWADSLALNLTALQFALPLIDRRGISAEEVEKKFLKNFEVIEKFIPKATSIFNQKRALKDLESFINTHPRYFKAIIELGQTSQKVAVSSADGAANECYGYIFMCGDKKGAIAIDLTAIKKILEKELGYSSADAILTYWNDDGLIDVDKERKFVKQISVPDGRIRAVYFPNNHKIKVNNEDVPNEEKNIQYSFKYALQSSEIPVWDSES